MKEKMQIFWEWVKNRNYQWRFKLFIMVPIIVLLLVLDWTTKAWAVQHLDHESIQYNWAPGFIVFKYMVNQGSAYGAMADKPALVITLASIITIVCLFLFVCSSNKMIIATFAIIFGGSFGNLLARAWEPTNGVVDFLVWDFWNAGNYIFNLADLFVNIGIGLAILSIIIYVVQFTVEWVFKSKHPDEAEKISDLESDNARMFFEIENGFWTNRLAKWKTERNVLRARINENKANIVLIKSKVKEEKIKAKAKK
jgi:signal peptidase II